MKISNFNVTRVVLLNTTFPLVDTVYATVDVSTGHLWWKNTETREAVSGIGGVTWFFLDNGKPTPDYEVEALARAYKYRWLNGDWRNHPKTEIRPTGRF